MCFGSRLKGSQFSDINSAQPIRPVDITESGSRWNTNSSSISDPTKQPYAADARSKEADAGAEAPRAEGNPTNPTLDPGETPGKYSASYNTTTSTSTPATTAMTDKPTPLSPSDVTDPQMKERLNGKKSAHTGKFRGWQGPSIN